MNSIVNFQLSKKLRSLSVFFVLFIASGQISFSQSGDQAEEWLKNIVKAYFKQDSKLHFRDITTTRYAEYKQDAINLTYDTDETLTREQFETKWKAIYDTSYAGIGESFLIGQQDYGIVSVSQCKLISSVMNQRFIFDTKIKDTSFEAIYSIQITVVYTSGGYKIDDIKRERNQ